MEKVELPEGYAEAACRAARLLGLNIAGVDLLEGRNGPLVLEVNSSPGLEGIEKASGVNVAAAIVEFVMEDTAFSEVDIGQLLRTVPGSGVLSLQLRNHPKMVGRRLREVFASIPVFALSRGNRLVWNPDPDVQLRYDDVLVCYGELTELLLPYAKPCWVCRHHLTRSVDVRRASRENRGLTASAHPFAAFNNTQHG